MDTGPANRRSLPSAPPKPSDRRGRHFSDTETWQAEALDPIDLARILEDTIRARLNRAYLRGHVRRRGENSAGRDFPTRGVKPDPASAGSPEMTAFNSAIRLTNHPSTCRSGAPRCCEVMGLRAHVGKRTREAIAASLASRCPTGCGLACLEDPDEYADT